MVLPLTATLSRLYVVVIFPLMSSLSSSSSSSPSPPSCITLFFLFFYQIYLLPSARAFTINTAELCRPDRTIPHAPALFGPKPDQSGIHNVKLFAPRPQENGVYLNIPSSALTSSPTIIKSANSKNLDRLIHQQQHHHQQRAAMPAQGLMFHRNLLSLFFGNGHEHAQKQQQRINIHTVHLSSSTSSADSPHDHGVSTGTQSKQQQQRQQHETRIGRIGGGGMFVHAAPMKQQHDIYTHSNSRHDHHPSNSKSIATSTSTMNIISRPSSVSSSPSLSTQQSSSTPTPTPLPTPQPQFLRSFISPWRAWTNRHRTTDQYQTLSQLATNSLAHSSNSYQTPPLAQPPNYIPIPVVDHDSSERQDLLLSSSESEHKHGPDDREPPSLETDTHLVRPSFESWRRSNKHSSSPTGTTDTATTTEQSTSSRSTTSKSDSNINPTRQDVSKNALEIPPLFDACIPLSVPADVETVKGRVAVVARGVCDFSEKVTLMQDAGAVGVIVVNSESDGNQLATMKRNDSKIAGAAITIPSVMISFQSWVKFAPCVNDTTVNFNAEGQYSNGNGRDALNWAMMRGMALWILCQCGVNVVRYKRRVSEFRARADAIAALPVDTYSRSRNQQRRNRHRNNISNSSSGGVGSSSNSGHNHSNNNNNNSHEHSSSSSNSNIINNNINNVSNDNNENLNNNHNLNVNSNINHHNHNIMCDHTSSTTTTASLPLPSSVTDDEKWQNTACGTAGSATTATGRTSTTPQSAALSSCTQTGLDDNVSSSSFSSMALPSSVICDAVQQQGATDIYQCQHSKPYGMRSSSSMSATTRSRPLSMPVGVGYNLTADEHINLIGPSASASASSSQQAVSSERMSNTGDSSLSGREGNDGENEGDDGIFSNGKNMDGNKEETCLQDGHGHVDDNEEDDYDEDELANTRRGVGKRRRGCGSSCDTPSVPLLATTSSNPSSSSSPPQSQLQTTTPGPSSSSESSSSSGRQIALPQSGSGAGTASGNSNILDEDEVDTDEDDGLCAICLEEFEEGQEVRPLACRHLYHRSCIDPWLQSSSNCCPLCKREVPNLPPPPTQLHYGSMIV